MLKLLDIHTHYPTGDSRVIEIENIAWSQPDPPSGLNVCRSVGLHPWYLSDFDPGQARQWLSEQIARPDTVAIGEGGLDKITATPWHIQERAFQICIALAVQHRLPLIIHCVKAWQEVLQHLTRAMSTPFPIPVVFHGFNKHPETAQMLLRAGCYLSFGAALLKENAPAVAAFLQTPDDRFFLETDASQIPISDVYQQAARLRNTSAEQIAEQIRATNYELRITKTNY